MAVITLSVDEIKYIGTLIPQLKSPISPLASSAAVNPVNTQRLVQLGVLNQAGQITANFLPTFQALSQARSFAGFGYIGSVIGYEAVNFFCPGRTISLGNRSNGIEISDPAPTEIVIESLAQRVGRSAFAIADLEMELSVVESLAFVAMIDLFRRVQLAQMLEQKVNVQISLDEIVAWIHRGGFSAPWLMGHFQIYLGQKIECSKEDIHKAVASLSEKGAVKLEGSHVRPEDDMRMLVSRFLVIDHLIDVKAGRVLPDGTVVNVNIEVVQAGLNDLLLWERVENSVFWKLISPDHLIGMVSGLISQAEALKPFDKLAKQETPQPAQGAKHCTNCGVVLAPDAKFCKGCGAALQRIESKSICQHCNNPIKEGAKFCNHCGKPLS
jgi:hypothetical protein